MNYITDILGRTIGKNKTKISAKYNKQKTLTLHAYTYLHPEFLHCSWTRSLTLNHRGDESQGLHRHDIAQRCYFLPKNIPEKKCPKITVPSQLGDKRDKFHLTAILLTEICPAPVVCTWSPGRAVEHRKLLALCTQADRLVRKTERGGQVSGHLSRK